jgi:hypothetical protein
MGAAGGVVPGKQPGAGHGIGGAAQGIDTPTATGGGSTEGCQQLPAAQHDAGAPAVPQAQAAEAAQQVGHGWGQEGAQAGRAE